MEPRANPGNRLVDVVDAFGADALQWSPGRTLGIDRPGPGRRFAGRPGFNGAQGEPWESTTRRTRPRTSSSSFNGAQGEPWESTASILAGGGWTRRLQWSPGRTLGIDASPEASIASRVGRFNGAQGEPWESTDLGSVFRLFASLASMEPRANPGNRPDRTVTSSDWRPNASMEPRANPGNRPCSDAIRPRICERLQWSPGRTLGIDRRCPILTRPRCSVLQWSPGRTLGIDARRTVPDHAARAALQWSPGRTLGIDRTRSRSGGRRSATLQWSPGRTLGIDLPERRPRDPRRHRFNGAQGEPWESTSGRAPG